jgi:hypothetical protein
MKQKLKQIQALQNLSEMTLNKSLAQLSEIAVEEQKMRDTISQIDEDIEHQRAHLNDGMQSLSHAVHFGMDIKWADWVKREKRKHLTALATIAERRELQLVETRRAFGRVDALKAIKKKMQT